MVPPANDLPTGMIIIPSLLVLLLDETSKIIEKLRSKINNKEAMRVLFIRQQQRLLTVTDDRYRHFFMLNINLYLRIGSCFRHIPLHLFFLHFLCR